MTASDLWKLKFGEYPKTDADKLAVVMMREYAEQQIESFIDWYRLNSLEVSIPQNEMMNPETMEFK